MTGDGINLFQQSARKWPWSRHETLFGLFKHNIHIMFIVLHIYKKVQRPWEDMNKQKGSRDSIFGAHE